MTTVSVLVNFPTTSSRFGESKLIFSKTSMTVSHLVWSPRSVKTKRRFLEINTALKRLLYFNFIHKGVGDKGYFTFLAYFT